MKQLKKGRNLEIETKNNTQNLLSQIQDFLLISFLLLFPFTLVLGRIFPSLVSFPLYIPDFLLLLLTIVLLLRFFRKEFCLTETSRLVCLLFCLFILTSTIFILLHWTDLASSFSQNSSENIRYVLFKQLLSSDALHGLSKLFHLFLAFILFLSVLTTSFRKERLFQILCIPLLIIILTNLYLSATSQDVSLDGGKPLTLIHPYPLSDYGRIYFPFVNTLLLSLYLSLLFFVVLSLFLSQQNQQKIQYLYGSLLFLVVLVLGLTKGRTAILVLCLLFPVSWFFIHKKKEIFSQRHPFFFSFLTLFLVFTLFFSFFSFHFQTDTAQEVKETTQQVKETSEDQVKETTQQVKETSKVYVFRELDKNTENKGRWILHWPTALLLFEQSPFFGVGTGLYFSSVLGHEKEILCQTPKLCPDNMPGTDISSTAHSIYLQVLAENGIIGFVLFLLLVGSVLFLGFKQMKSDAFSFFLLLALVCFLLQGILFSYFEYIEMTYLFWAIGGSLFIFIT